MKIQQILKSKKGNSAIISMLIVLPLLLSVTLNPILMYLDIMKYQKLEEIAKNYTVRMEIEGGLTATALSSMIEEINNAGFDISKTHIDYTPYPVDFGSDVKLKITSTIKTGRISLIKAGGMKNETIQVVIGPYVSVSKKKIN